MTAQAHQVSQSTTHWEAYAKAQISSDALLQSQRIASFADAALKGDAPAFEKLSVSQSKLNQDLDLLSNGGTYGNHKLSAASLDEQASLLEVKHVWQGTAQAVDFILSHEHNVHIFYAAVARLDALTPTQLDLSQQVTALYTEKGTAREVNVSGQLPLLTAKPDAGANAVFATDTYNPEIGFQLSKDATAFDHITDGLLNGNSVWLVAAVKDDVIRGKLTELRAAFSDYNNDIQSIIGDLGNIARLKVAESNIAKGNDTLSDSLTALKAKYLANTNSQ